MWITILLLLIAGAASAEELQPVAIAAPGTTGTAVLSEVQALKIENANLRFQLSSSQAQIASMAQNAVIGQVCSELNLGDCQIDMATRTARGTPAPAASTATARPSPRSPVRQPAKKTGTQP